MTLQEHATKDGDSISQKYDGGETAMLSEREASERICLSCTEGADKKCVCEILRSQESEVEA